MTRTLADRALTRLGVDDLGLDGADRRYLRLIAENYGGGPVGVETLVGRAVRKRATRIEEVIEPFLLQQGLIQRTPRGPDAGGEGLDATSGSHPRGRRRGPRISSVTAKVARLWEKALRLSSTE